MGLCLHHDHTNIVDQIEKLTADHNDNLLQQYKDKKISPMKYKIMKRDPKREIIAAKRVNMIVSPFLAIPITLTLLLKLLSNS